MVHRDRRAYLRQNLSRPCKLYLPKAGTYVGASTWNVSPGGALVRIDRRAPVAPGDRLYLGIAFTRRQAIITARQMLETEVVRVMETFGDSVEVAVRFTELEAMPMAA